MELLMIYKISPSPSLPSGPEALWAGGQRGGKKGKTFLKKEREKAEMTHSITRRAFFSIRKKGVEKQLTNQTMLVMVRKKNGKF